MENGGRGCNLSAYDLTLYKKNFNRKKVYLHTLSGNVFSGGVILLLVLSGKVLDKLLGMPFLKKLEQLTSFFLSLMQFPTVKCILNDSKLSKSTPVVHTYPIILHFYTSAEFSSSCFYCFLPGTVTVFLQITYRYYAMLKYLLDRCKKN